MPTLRTDVVDVYVARRGALGLEFLQLLRAQEPLAKTWQPVMGHVEANEHGVQAAKREMKEEVGLACGDGHVLAMYALEQVHPFYIAELDCVMLSPRFVVEVAAGWSPSQQVLLQSTEHTEHRWVQESRAADCFMWPGQRAALQEVGRVLRGCESAAQLLIWKK
jgi:dATP pyrophosphohydrolase